MKNRIYQSLFLGLTSAIAASASYALITPKNIDDMDGLSVPSLYETASGIVPSINTEHINKRPQTIDHTIEVGENLSAIFSRFNIDDALLHQITHSNDIGEQFANLVAGKNLRLKLDSEGGLESLIYQKDSVNTLIATRNGDDFDVKMDSKQVDHKEALVQSTITSSLSSDGAKVGLSPKLINKLADEIFAWDIDFSEDLRDGDKFTIIYEQALVDGKQIDTGDILAAEFVVQGKAYSAIRYKDKEGNVTYYSPKGKGMRKTFLRSPIEFARVTSEFNLHRLHPILHTIRAHKGVDYGAKIGTPIKATGDGKITFRGTQNGYGNVVIIQHGEKYSTLYGHMSRFNPEFAFGSSVKQGDVIGYVGQSGLATGPHLHYEFRINGVYQNPLAINLDYELPIDKKFLAEFKAQTQPYIDQLNQANTETADIKVENLVAQKSP